MPSSLKDAPPETAEQIFDAIIESMLEAGCPKEKALELLSALKKEYASKAEPEAAEH